MLDADGEPRVRVFVYVRGEGYQAMSWSDEAGEFDIRGLPPGTYRLWVHGRTAGSRGPEVQVASGATNVELRAP